MNEQIEVSQDRLMDCVKVICKTCEDNGFTQLEAGFAMLAILDSFKEQGLEVGMEKRLNS